MYDAFISHRSDNKPWVEVLAKNLGACGLRPWLDIWEMKAGGAVGGQLQEGLRLSRNGILVATPEALASAWVQREYEAMLARQREQPDFRIIPLTFGSLQRFPFLQTQICVDFADPKPEAYRTAFHSLLCGLRDRAPGPTVDLPAEVAIPGPMTPRLEDMAVRPLGVGEAGLLAQVFESLHGNRPVMLFAQADQDPAAMHRALLDEARRKYGAGRTFHLVPPGQAGVDPADYFAYLGHQIDKTRPCTRPFDFELLLSERLERGEPLFLFITRIEDGSPEARIVLSRTLRNLGELHSGLLRLVLCGSEQLMGLRFSGGHLSPLGNADILFWPEPTADDLRRPPPDGPALDPPAADELLRLTGGNARLLRHGLALYREGRCDEAGLREKLRRDPFLHARFVAYRENGEAGRVVDWLRKDDLGAFDYWPPEPLPRRLFWDSLTVERGGRFQWRCELIRRIGREVLGC